jgi:phenylalanyl-tRNA synthetase beta chain
VETERSATAWKERVAGWLVGQGYYEILTNSITNSAYFTETELESAVKMINNLSAELNIMRPSLLETGLESIAYNLNRKNNNLQFFEFGKSYHSAGVGNYIESDHLCLYCTGQLREDSWKARGERSDFYYLKGLCERIFRILGLYPPAWEPLIPAYEGEEAEAPRPYSKLSGLAANLQGQVVLEAGLVSHQVLRQFDIRQPVLFADLRWDLLLREAEGGGIEFRELPKQLPVQRDLAMVVDRGLPFEKVEKSIRGLKLGKLQEIRLFDIFESEKLGADKKSLAVNFSFLDEEKTLTDKEIDGMVGRIREALENELGAEIRK